MKATKLALKYSRAKAMSEPRIRMVWSLTQGVQTPSLSSMKSGQMDLELTEKEEIVEEPQVLSVSDLNALIRGTLESQFDEVWVRAEISNFKAHTSGHFYFTLKDDKAQVNAVMFRGMNSKLKFRPENGLEVMVHGKVTVYEPRGNYQVFCQWMEPVGAGALQKAFEQLKAKLQKEGLFAPERKRALPAFPKHIGLVTSPTGAAIRDILNVLRRRYKSAKVTLSPALVQGDTAADSIVKAIELINKLKDVDVLIVGRGGGSAEDMWCFNEEKVARAIAASRIPVISAVGHEVDFTIADFVADLRAPTPSAAAELVVKNAGDLVNHILQLQKRLMQSMQSILREQRDGLRTLKHRLVDPRRRLQDLILRCDELTNRIEQGIWRYISDCQNRIELATQKLKSPIQMQLKDHRSDLREKMARLEAMSPLAVVQRGYSIVTVGKNKVVKSVSQIQPDSEIQIQFAEGKAEAKVLRIEKESDKK